jgi:hypothetical protein
MFARPLIQIALALVCLGLLTSCNPASVGHHIPDPPPVRPQSLPDGPPPGAIGQAAGDVAGVLADLLGDLELVEATAQAAVGVPWAATEVHCRALSYEQTNGLSPSIEQYQLWISEAVADVARPIIEGESRDALVAQLSDLQARVMALRASDYATFVEYYTQTC